MDSIKDVALWGITALLILQLTGVSGQELVHRVGDFVDQVKTSVEQKTPIALGGEKAAPIGEPAFTNTELAEYGGYMETPQLHEVYPDLAALSW